MMESYLCKHVIDGKEIYFEKSKCPICRGTLQKMVEKKQTVYRKGNTVVIKSGKNSLSTITWWKEGERFLMSVKEMVRDEKGKVVLGNDGKPMFNQLTIRLTVEQTKELVKLLDEMITEVKQSDVRIERG